MKYTKKGTITTRPRKYPAEQIAELYLGGLNCSEIGRRLGIHHSTVLHALDFLKTPRRPGVPQRRGNKRDPNWIDFSEYREKWRAERGIGAVERMMQIVSPRKSRFAA